jgi:hypothetical protein
VQDNADDFQWLQGTCCVNSKPHRVTTRIERVMRSAPSVSPPISARFGIGAEVPTIFGVETVAALLLSASLFCQQRNAHISTTISMKDHVEEQADKRIDHFQIFPSREMKTSDTA